VCVCVCVYECRTIEASSRQQCCLIGYKAEMNEAGLIFTPAVMRVYLSEREKVMCVHASLDKLHKRFDHFFVIFAVLAETQQRLSKIICLTLGFLR